MPAEICIYLCRCISVVVPSQVLDNGKFDLGTICSQKVRESVPMYNCHSGKSKLKGKNHLETCSSFFYENNTINSFEFPEIPKSGGSFFFHF
jgi:hypothetical protein